MKIILVLVFFIVGFVYPSAVLDANEDISKISKCKISTGIIFIVFIMCFVASFDPILKSFIISFYTGFVGGTLYNIPQKWPMKDVV